LLETLLLEALVIAVVALTQPRLVAQVFLVVAVVELLQVVVFLVLEVQAL
jgi:hypothetical protein